MAQRLRLEQSWRIVPLEALVAPAFVLPESIDQNDASVIEHVLIKKKSEWSEIFLDRN